MAIFDNNFLFESASDMYMDDVHADTSVAPTMESIVEMNAELSEGVYRLNSSLYIADLLSEQSGDVSLMEASLEDFWEKTKRRFKELWEKIKGFFKNLLAKMKVIFQTGDEFIKRYKTVITKISNDKDAKYDIFHESYSTYPANVGKLVELISKGETNSGFSGKAKVLDNTINQIITIVSMGAKTTKNVAGDETSSSDSEKKALKERMKNMEMRAYQQISSRSSNAKDCKKEFRKQYFDFPTTIADKKMIEEMLTYCETWLKDGKKNVLRSQSDMDKVLGKTMKAIESFKRSHEEATKNNNSVMDLVTEATSILNKMIGVANYINGISFSTFNSAYNTYVGALKSFVRRNSKLIKKNDIAKRESYTDSILDSIMGSF